MKKRKAKRAGKRPLTGEECLNPDNIDIEKAENFVDQCQSEPAALRLLKAAASAPLRTESGQKTRKRKKRSNQNPSSVTSQVYEELQQPGFALTEARRLRSGLVLEPRPELAWTKELRGYNEARLSAENAIGWIYAGTEAASAGRHGDPWLDVCLYQVRARLLQADSPEILRCLQHAQRIGKGEWFIEQLAADFKKAGKRVPHAHQFSELRALLAHVWMSNCLWLMSDGVIASRLHKSREAVRKAVKELKLMKQPETARAPIVKGVDSDGRFIFRAGYPPKV
jgi:hypothetical protein